MKLINALQSKPAFLLIMMIAIVSILIIGVVVVLLCRLASEKKVTEAALELKRITNSIRAGLVHFSLEDFRILYASHGFYEMLGYDKSSAKAEGKLTILDFIDSRDTHFIDSVKEQLGNDVIRCETRMISKAGNVLYTLMTGNQAVTKDGKHTLSVVFVDISEQKQMQELILLEGERYRIATELSKDVLFEYHFQKDEMTFTDKFRELFGGNPIIYDFCSSSESRRDTIHPDDWGIYLELCEELRQGKSIIEAEFRIKGKLEQYIWCQLMGKTIYDDDKNPIRIIGKLVNIDTQKRELEALEYKATRDPLTGVYNKEITIKKIDKYISGNRYGLHVLMFVDFDDFKKINDNYGHLLGDKVLTHVIGCIKERFHDGEIIGRIGGDEFVVFVGNITDINEVLNNAKQLKEALDTICVYNNHSIKISASIGIAVYPEAGHHYEQLIFHADQALYQVKEKGKNDFMVYKPAI
jgi:diguanylate cyclase (GGDEF)-like protein/PAS domain S-box-containing protein